MRAKRRDAFSKCRDDDGIHARSEVCRLNGFAFDQGDCSSGLLRGVGRFLGTSDFGFGASRRRCRSLLGLGNLLECTLALLLRLVGLLTRSARGALSVEEARGLSQRNRPCKVET